MDIHMSNGSAKKVKKAKKDKKDKKSKRTPEEKAARKAAKAAKAAAKAAAAGGDDAAPATTPGRRMRTRSMDAAEGKKRKASDAGEDSGVPVKRQRVAKEPAPRVHRMRTRSIDVKEGKKEEDGAEDDENNSHNTTTPFSEFRIRDCTVKALNKRGITGLFPIQKMTFDPIFEGQDVVGRARTGMGKTLAFTLPCVEKLFAEDSLTFKTGRKPVVLVLAPTRELAKQVSADFSSVSGKLVTLSVYGGTQINPQSAALWRGVDVVVGTPGRVIDHINRGNLDVSLLKFLILDEADQMLDMGFKDDMETIMSHIPALAECQSGKAKTGGSMQTLLFSATVPAWVKDVATKYMHKPKWVDLVGELKQKASKNVEHLCLQCPWQNKAAAVGDLIKVYAGHKGRVLVFCDTKKEANELAVNPAIQADTKCLHGDISQAQRETTLEAFRAGTVRVVLATDVAARGLDINNVELVIQMQPPAGKFTGKPDIDTYVHRSGRTGRAGRQGTAITLYTRNQEFVMQAIEKKTGNTFTRIGAPQPADLIRASAKDCVTRLESVHEESLEFFMDTAKEILEDKEPVDALAAALAVMSGYTDQMQSRSLLSASDGYVTLLFKSREGYKVRSATYVWNGLRMELPSRTVDCVRGMTLMEDGTGAAFDIPAEFLPEIKKAVKVEGSCLEIAKTLPELVAPPQQFNNSYSGGYRNGGRSGGRGGRSGGRGGFRSGGFRRGGRGGGRGRGGRGGGRGRGGGGRRW